MISMRAVLLASSQLILGVNGPLSGLMGYMFEIETNYFPNVTHDEVILNSTSESLEINLNSVG